MNDRDKNLLRSIYYNPEHGLGSARSLYNQVKDKGIKFSDIKSWVDNQESVQIFKEIRNKAYPAIIAHTDNDYQCDLMFIDEFKKYNKGFSIVFTLIELTSRKAYAYPLKNKSEKSISEAFNLFLKTVKKVSNLTSDNGTEFTNKTFERIVKANHIKHYFAEKGDKHKMGKIERFNRTLRDKITKYMNTFKTMKWIHVLDKLILNYNNTIHSRTGYAPNKVTILESIKIRNKERQKSMDAYNVINNLNVGDRVRILKNKELFDKGKATYTKNIYTINEIDKLALIVKNTDGSILNKRIKPYNILKVNEIIEKAPEEEIIEYDNEVDKNKRSRKRGRSLRKEGIITSENLVPKQNKRIIPSEKIVVGSRVKSLFNYEGKKVYFKGVVTKVNLKTFNVTFDDGNKHQMLKEEVKLDN